MSLIPELIFENNNLINEEQPWLKTPSSNPVFFGINV